MNYCPTAGASQLSPGDVLGVQRAYGRKPPGSLESSAGMCADVAGGSSTIGAPVIGFPCRGQFNDLWFRASADQHLVAAFPGVGNRCLNVQGGVVSPTAPTPIISWSCTPTTNEDFTFTNVEWRAMGNMCATASGTSVTMNPCNGSLSQKWTLLDGDPNTSLRFDQILSASTGRCISAATTNGSLGEALSLVTCSTTDARQRFAYRGQGIIGFGNFCLNVFGGLPTPGSTVGLWDGCTAANYNEVFTISGNVRSLGQCLDGSNNNQISVSTCSSSNTNQVWEYFL